MLNTYRFLFLAVAALWLQGCDNGSLPPVPMAEPQPPTLPAMASFDVSVDNLTNAQPLSPVAVIGHLDGYAVFVVGNAATVGLEDMAEGGDNTALLAEADGDANVLVSASGAAPIGPAGSETVSIELLESDVANLKISVATMLVNTNDAFSALDAMDVSSLAVGDSIMVELVAYDAGTEADTEAAGDIPGPAGGGEGFNMSRSDAADRIAMHAGVVSQDDGFATSDLTEQHRFDNPVMRVRIARTQ